MIEYSLSVGTWYTMIGFGPADLDAIGMEEGDEFHMVGSLLQRNKSRPGTLVVVTATHSGNVGVRVRSWAAGETVAELQTDSEDWATSSFESPSGDFRAQLHFGDGDTSPNLVSCPGRYGVRVSATGRDVVPSDDPFAIGPDRYVVDIWPAPDGVEEEFVTRSEWGKSIALSYTLE